MTQKEREKKAFEAYPTKKVPGTGVGDYNSEHREGYIQALTEISELPTIHGWVARCKWACPQELYFYKGEKPVRCGSQVEDAGGDFYWDFNEEIIPLPPTLFPDLKWEDEPIEVELPIITIGTYECNNNDTEIN